ncbi:hypothetical protein [Sulfurimonas paralvinellae]|uniref:Uncharacterized protein n=1 Tax=Sulfurimonas paralvinellae TaxID=317658 RepID=A0A7M1B526_9BACT|nr:hypothetical protein [Sulfurimonas paralvinellae]QOP44829.1 hypothetical protein FM071_00340 [Sulfurimonas paralvinellae]
MDIVLLIKSIMGLVVILGILIVFFLYMPFGKEQKTQKKKVYTQPSKPKPKHELKELLSVIRDKNATNQQLSEALDAIIKYHGHIPSKLGIRCHPDFDIYSEILLRICRHPNTDKDIIVNFDKELEKRNPEYVREINDSLTKGLNSRGI